MGHQYDEMDDGFWLGDRVAPVRNNGFVAGGGGTGAWLARLARPATEWHVAGEESAGPNCGQGCALGGGFAWTIHAGHR